MSRFTLCANLLILMLLASQAAWAEDSAAVEEVRGLRALVEKQSKQIDSLTEQIAKLRIVLEKAGEIPFGTANPAPAPAPAPPVAAAAPSPAVEFSSDIPKAEAADGKRHIVIKGETLTSIAKHYNLLVSELKKANKDVDERKLQIGQNLIIPTPKGGEPSGKSAEPSAKGTEPSKAAEAPAEKNP